MPLVPTPDLGSGHLLDHASIRATTPATAAQLPIEDCWALLKIGVFVREDFQMIHDRARQLADTWTDFASNTQTSLKQRMNKYYTFYQQQHHANLHVSRYVLHKYIQ